MFNKKQEFISFYFYLFLLFSIFILVVPFEQRITPLDIISYGRLAVTVKKSPVLVTIDNSDIVRYTTIDWQGVT